MSVFGAMILAILATSPQVSGVPEAITIVKHPTCNLGPRVTDTVHPGHTCPEGMLLSECWWLWHCCEDSHGHALRPYLNEEVECAKREGRTPDCGAAATLLPGVGCAPHSGAHVTEAALAEYCRRFYPDDPQCGSR